MSTRWLRCFLLVLAVLTTALLVSAATHAAQKDTEPALTKDAGPEMAQKGSMATTSAYEVKSYAIIYDFNAGKAPDIVWIYFLSESGGGRGWGYRSAETVQAIADLIDRKLSGGGRVDYDYSTESLSMFDK